MSAQTEIIDTKPKRQKGRILTALGFGFFIDSAEDQALYEQATGGDDTPVLHRGG